MESKVQSPLAQLHTGHIIYAVDVQWHVFIALEEQRLLTGFMLRILQNVPRVVTIDERRRL